MCVACIGSPFNSITAILKTDWCASRMELVIVVETLLQLSKYTTVLWAVAVKEVLGRVQNLYVFEDRAARVYWVIK